MDRTFIAAPPTLSPGWRVATLFLLLYVLLDWASYLRPLVQGFNITPWNPQQALAVALLVWWRSSGWLVLAAVVTAEIVVRGWNADSLALWTAGAALTLTFMAIARELARQADPMAIFASHSGLLRFAAIVTGGSLVAAVCYVTIVSTSQHVDEGQILTGIAAYWVGDAVGLLVTLPLFLLATTQVGRSALVGVLGHGAWWISVVLTGGALWLIVGPGEQDQFKFFYLLMLPVVWSSVRYGVSGAVLSANATQLGLIFASQQFLAHDSAVFQLQALMAASAATALLLGVLVDERARAESELRAGLRFSAAGQMAAGLAHELGQPLTALNNFADSCRVLLAHQPEQRDQLAATIDRVVAEATRAGDVARRLRDFFGTGAMAMQLADLEELLLSAVRDREPDAHAAGVRLRVEVPGTLPAVWIDPVQIRIVIRNLLANAIESAASGEQPLVVVSSSKADRSVLVQVRDSGPGIEAARMASLFDGGASSKLAGMGVGLSICRTMIEAHGGKLWARPGPGGYFLFTLPIEKPDEP